MILEGLRLSLKSIVMHCGYKFKKVFNKIKKLGNQRRYYIRGRRLITVLALGLGGFNCMTMSGIVAWGRNLLVLLPRSCQPRGPWFKSSLLLEFQISVGSVAHPSSSYKI